MSLLVSTFSHSPIRRIRLELLLVFFHSIVGVGIELLGVRGSCQCITPLRLPSLCLCAVSTQAEKKLVISFFAKISICIISEMCFFIRHFQTDEFGNPLFLYYPG